MLRRLPSFLAAAFMAAGLHTAARAAPDPVVIGVLTDMSSILSDALGAGSVDTTRMAIEDFGGQVLGRPIKLIFADHLSKADIGAGIANKWIDEDAVRLFVDLGNSAVALAVQNIAQQKDRIVITTGAASSDITGKNCTATTFAWGYDTYQFSHVAVPALLAEGTKTWFLIIPDYAFGHAMARDITKVIEQAGGKVLGTAVHPAGTTDYASYLLKAQSMQPQAIGFLGAVADLQNSLKQAREFGILAPPMKAVAPGMMLVDEHAVGTDIAQGIYVSSVVFYWNMNADVRTWSERFRKRNGKWPTEAQAMNYSAVTHYLKAVAAAGTTDTAAVVAKMREMPVNDLFTHDARIRADGRLMRDVNLAQVKKPSEVKEAWDDYTILQRIPAAQVFRPVEESECKLLKK